MAKITREVIQYPDGTTKTKEFKFGKKGEKILVKETYRIKKEEDICNLPRFQQTVFSKF